MMPATLMSADLLTQSTESNANLFQKHLDRYTQVLSGHPLGQIDTKLSVTVYKGARITTERTVRRSLP